MPWKSFGLSWISSATDKGIAIYRGVFGGNVHSVRKSCLHWVLYTCFFGLSRVFFESFFEKIIFVQVAKKNMFEPCQSVTVTVVFCPTPFSAYLVYHIICPISRTAKDGEKENPTPHKEVRGKPCVVLHF